MSQHVIRASRSHRRRIGQDVAYLLRDRFLTDRALGAVIGTAAEPGPGNRVGSDVESKMYIANDRLLGIYQPTSPVWGEAKVVWSSQARQAGRTFVALLNLADVAERIAIGWSSADDIGDPTADGHAWYSYQTAFYAVTPGQLVTLQSHTSDTSYIRTMQYLVLVALNDIGAVLLLSTIADDTGGGMLDSIGIPQYPNARVVWAEPGGTTDPMFPFVSGYGNSADPYPVGHMLEDVRVYDVESWAAADGLASMADRFTRADDATAIGNGWAADTRVWGISSNSAYCVSGSSTAVAWKDTGIADGIFQLTVTTPASDTEFCLILRRSSAGNYIRLQCDMAADTLRLQAVVNNVAATFYQRGWTWNTGTTYEITLYVTGNQYKVFVDKADATVVWRTDAGNNFLTATGIGISTLANDALSPRFDRVAAYAHTVDLTGLIPGNVPEIWSPGAMLAQDTFTDGDGTPLAAHTAESGGAWTEVRGAWTISSNAAIVADDGASDFYALQDVGVDDYECSLDVTIPDLADPVGGQLMQGIIARYTDESNYLYIRLACASPTTATYHEIEVFGKVAGAGAIISRASIGDPWLAATTVTLKVQVRGDLVRIFEDDLPRFSHILPAALATGSKCGLYVNETAIVGNYDNWHVKAL